MDGASHTTNVSKLVRWGEHNDTPDTLDFDLTALFSLNDNEEVVPLSATNDFDPELPQNDDVSSSDGDYSTVDANDLPSRHFPARHRTRPRYLDDYVTD